MDDAMRCDAGRDGERKREKERKFVMAVYMMYHAEYAERWTVK